MLNFEDTEEAPGSEELDQCNMFDNDIDKMPLFQPRGTFDSHDFKVRNSCPATGFTFAAKDEQEQVSTFSISSASSTLSLRLIGKVQGN
jgi:hypothetical protein